MNRPRILNIWNRNRKHILLIFSIFAIIALSPIVINATKSFAEDAEQIQKEIEKKQKYLKETENELNKIKDKASQITSTLNKLSGDLNVNQSQVNTLKAQIDELSEDISNLDSKMDIKKSDLDKNTKIRDIALKDLYIQNKVNLFEVFLAETGVQKMYQNASYYLNFIDNSENLISNISQDIAQYQKDKEDLAQLKQGVEKQKEHLQKIVNQLASQVNQTKSELSQVSQKQVALQQEKSNIEKKLSELSAKQKEILGEKTESFETSVGEVPSTGDTKSQANYDPGFRSAFAGFSFGAPHRKGMSQYGAKGRAESGQDYKTILKAYYGDVEIKEVDVPKNINTDKGSMELDGKYLKGLGEMPGSWPKEALKAQAVAARTYALSYVGWRMSNNNASGKICTNEGCQVWSQTKYNAGGAWHDAVSSTKAQVMVSKKTGEIFSPLYAATSGGYNYSYSSLGHTTKGGWDTKCGGKECWTSDAYESKAGSPWFYKGWYKTRSGKTCGRAHPWMTEKEFADIVGAVYLYTKNSGDQKHLSQPDAKSCWGKSIPDTWSVDTVKEKSGIKEVTDVDVSYSSNGYTSEVRVKTNKGELKFSGEDFKAIFNLRAPGTLNLKSALFNIEVKK